MNVVAPGLRRLPWDTQFFGVEIGCFEAGEIASESSLDEALAACREAGVELLYVRSAAEAMRFASAVQVRGGRLVDLRLTLDLVLPARTPKLRPRVRSARPEDTRPLAEMARVSHRASRFYADQRLDATRCDDLYALWIEKSCCGWVDAVFVGVDEAGAAGYVTCRLKPPQTGSIELVAAAERARGTGLGREMLEATLDWLSGQGVTRVEVVTQGANIAAQRLYQASGFRSARLEFWHHVWF